MSSHEAGATREPLGARLTPPVSDRTVIEVHDLVREMILTGDLVAASSISQVRLSRRLGVSRTPLREAIRMLEREGLVECQPNRRTMISPTSLEDLDALYSVRIVLESVAVSSTVTQLSNAEISELRTLLTEMERCVAERDVSGWATPHQRFHGLLVRGAGIRMQVMLAALRDHSRRYVQRFISEPLSWASSLGEHVRMVEAIEASDAKAASQQLSMHLARTSLTLLAGMDPAFDAAATRAALQLVISRTGFRTAPL